MTNGMKLVCYLGNILNSPCSDSVVRKQSSDFVNYIPTETREWSDHIDVSFIDMRQSQFSMQGTI